MAVAIVSEKISALCRASLMDEGFSLLPLPASKGLSAPVSHHPDTVLARLGEVIFCPEDYYFENGDFFQRLTALCPTLRVHTLAHRHESQYPRECAYNMLTAADTAYFNDRALAPEIAEAAKEMGFRTVFTRQGYAACTVLMLGAGHAITADGGMARVLQKNGVRVLSIREGSILLPPYGYGFIGGASGVYGNSVYFFGEVERHPSYEAMRQFAADAGFTLKSLSNEPLCDLGGILFAEESTDQNADGRH